MVPHDAGGDLPVRPTETHQRECLGPQDTQGCPETPEVPLPCPREGNHGARTQEGASPEAQSPPHTRIRRVSGSVCSQGGGGLPVRPPSPLACATVPPYHHPIYGGGRGTSAAVSPATGLEVKRCDENTGAWSSSGHTDGKAQRGKS